MNLEKICTNFDGATLDQINELTELEYHVLDIHIYDGGTGERFIKQQLLVLSIC
jgi:hypothetical protein